MTVFKIINNDKTINIEFLDSDKILDIKKKIKSTNNGVYKPPQIESGETYIKDEQTFDLNSDKDFPTL
jgi:hypothetical protein